MKSINAPFAYKIKLPKTPKRKKVVVKTHQIRNLIKQLEQLEYASLVLRTKVAVLLAVTSGLRSEKVYNLTPNDIDIENRTVYVLRCLKLTKTV